MGMWDPRRAGGGLPLTRAQYVCKPGLLIGQSFSLHSHNSAAAALCSYIVSAVSEGGVEPVERAQSISQIIIFEKLRHPTCVKICWNFVSICFLLCCYVSPSSPIHFCSQLLQEPQTQHLMREGPLLDEFQYCSTSCYLKSGWVSALLL